jgi:hypothetical protein
VKQKFFQGMRFAFGPVGRETGEIGRLACWKLNSLNKNYLEPEL